MTNSSNSVVASSESIVANGNNAAEKARLPADEHPVFEDEAVKGKPALGHINFVRDAHNRVRLYVGNHQVLWRFSGAGHVTCVQSRDQPDAWWIVVRFESNDKNVLEILGKISQIRLKGKLRNSLEAQRQETSKSNPQLTAELYTSEAKNQETLDINHNLEQELSNAQAKIRDLEAKLEQTDVAQVIACMKEKVDKLENGEISRLQKENAKLSSENEMKSQELSSLQNRFAKLEGRIADLNEENAEMQEKKMEEELKSWEHLRRLLDGATEYAEGIRNGKLEDKQSFQQQRAPRLVPIVSPAASEKQSLEEKTTELGSGGGSAKYNDTQKNAMTELLKFFKVDDSTIYHDGFTYSFNCILDPPESSSDLELHQSFHCALREEENCRSRCHVIGNWETDKKGRKFMLGFIKKGDHTHGMEYRDTSPKLRFYKNNDESIHRNGFLYSFRRELYPPKQIENFQWHQTYHCAMNGTGQENCPARIYTTGQWEVNKHDLHYQLGIFKNCIHNHGKDQDSNEEDKENQNENNIVASASTHAKDLSIDKKEQIRFYKYKVTTVQRGGFVYNYNKDMKCHPKLKCRMRCERQINGKQTCKGYIWTTGKWDEDDRGRKFQLGIIMNGHDHEPYQIAFQGKENDDESPEAGLKFYKFMEKNVHRDGHVYYFKNKLKSHPPWKHRMMCTRKNQINRKLTCTGSIWTTGEWQTDSLGRLYQRGIPRGQHTHETYEQFLYEDDTAFVGGPMNDKQPQDEDDVVMIED